MNFKLWFLVFSFSLFASRANSANALPTAEDINNLAEKAMLTADTFMQKSFKLRMRYEFSGKFSTQQDKNNLYKLAKRAGNDLEEIANKQRILKNKIENYQGSDWDARYGSTGLWRKSAGYFYKTIFSKCEIDYYLALSAEQPLRNETLHRILFQIDSTFSHVLSDAIKLLKIKTLMLLAETESDYKGLAKRQLSSPEMIVPGMPCEFYVRGQMQKIKFTGKIKQGQLRELAQYLYKSDCADDLELVLSLAFLQRRYDPEGFEKTVSLWPQTEDFLGSLILSELSSRIQSEKLNKHHLQQISVFEAELAAQAAWKNKSKNHKTLLDYLSTTEKFQTPLILYVAAAAFADSSPIKTANLLVKASKLQQLKKSDKLGIEAEKIAKQAAQLAYNLFAQDTLNCQLALEAFENYSTVNEKIDEELEYLYTIILNDCGQAEKSKQLLEKIANRPGGNWRNKAKLDLIVQQMQQEHLKNQDRRGKMLKQLSNLIAECTGQSNEQNKIRTEAIIIYCHLLLEKEDRPSAQKVLNILSEEKPDRNLTITRIKSKALRLTGRLDQAANCLAESIIIDSGSLAGEVLELLSEVVDTIDQLQIQADDFDRMIQDCEKLAKFCNVCLNNRKSALLLAEISVLAANKEKSKLSEAEKLLHNLARDDDKDVDLLRCRARLLTAQGKFEKAAGLWTQICKIRKSDASGANQRSWKWWRAKFYELHCWAKIHQTEKRKVLHTIEVLENSFTHIPPLWAEKLNLLKQQCQSLRE